MKTTFRFLWLGGFLLWLATPNAILAGDIAGQNDDHLARPLPSQHPIDTGEAQSALADFCHYSGPGPDGEQLALEMKKVTRNDPQKVQEWMNQHAHVSLATDLRTIFSRVGELPLPRARR
jgi:hypothetical protein